MMHLGLRCGLLLLGPPIFLILQQPVNLGNKLHQFLGVLLSLGLLAQLDPTFRAFRMACKTRRSTKTNRMRYIT